MGMHRVYNHVIAPAIAFLVMAHFVEQGSIFIGFISFLLAYLVMAVLFIAYAYIRYPKVRLVSKETLHQLIERLRRVKVVW